MTTNPPDLSKVLAAYRSFDLEFQTLLMATCNSYGEPDASYAPYLKHMDYYYVYVSELSTHTENLMSTGRCSVLFIEEESAAKHLFARRRVTLQCQAEEIQRESHEFEQVLDLFVERFGKFMEMMRKLKDFHLFRLSPEKGAYVAGFAQAYTLQGEGLTEIKHRTEKGHRSTDPSTDNQLSQFSS
ncbi:MAG: pyridoxamine 5'-phosphate oxidase [Thiothrix sp.]|nr:MAG: pyridoxamine 5'-phosphate oxidase [Thiothrix sp.]